MKVVYAPDRSEDSTRDLKIFLGGSINMGAATLWQDQVIEGLKDVKHLTIFNPRRTDWDSSWEQKIENPQFYCQVTWELRHLEMSNAIIFYFDESGLAPITLMEFGIFHKRNVFVCCHPNYPRKGNVDIVCDRYGIDTYSSLTEVIHAVREWIEEC